MEARVNEFLPLAAKIAREFSNIPGLPHAEIDLAAHKLAGAAVAALRDRLEAMGFQGVDTLGFLKSCAQEIRADSPQVDDFSPQP